MNKNIKHKNKLAILIFLTTLSLGSVLSMAQKGFAADASSSCDAFPDGSDEKEKCEDLEKKAEVYREIIEIKQKQSNTLSNQLSITDTNIQQVQTQIDASKQQINDYNTQIIRLTSQIKEKEEVIDRQKKILAALMQSYWESTKVNPVSAYLGDGNFASFLVNKDMMSQTGEKIKNLLDTMTGLKSDLEKQSSELDKKKADVVLAHQDLQDKNSDLQSVKDQKADLLQQTKGEEARYSQMLARVEAQKQQLLNIDQLFTNGFLISGISAVDYIKKNEPPSDVQASIGWYYSQKDSRWADQNIGNSNSDMKNWGCAVTSVAMVAKFYGDSTTPGSLAKKPIFSSDLINWSMSGWSGAKIELASFGSSHGNLSWSKVDEQLKLKHPVIVYIGKTGGKGGHYVVIHTKDTKNNKYVVHDPYFGPNLYLDTSRALVGAMGVDSGTFVDQMIIYN